MTCVLSRRDVLATAGTLAAIGLIGVDRPARAEGSDDPTAGRSLVFEDGFSKIDQTVWHAGAKSTTFDSGFYGRSAFARLEGEEGFVPYAIVDNPSATGGTALQIAARYIGRPMTVPNYYGNELAEYQWISGNLQTAKPDGRILKGWRQGYFEARLWFPAHPLSFPAFWLMNGRSILFPSTSIELDVVEHKGWERNLYGAYLHEWGQPGEHHEGIGIPTPPDVTTAFFRYGLLIDGARCALYFERRPVIDPQTGKPVDWTLGRAQEMDDSGDVFWPLLTLALRSDVPVPDPLVSEQRQMHMLVDYFRVYA